MKFIRLVAKALGILMLLALSACGGGDSLSGETVAMAKLVLKNGTTGSDLKGQRAVDAELLALQQAGVNSGKAGCFILSYAAPEGVFWLIVNVPVEQADVAKALSFTPTEDWLRIDSSAFFYQLPCSTM